MDIFIYGKTFLKEGIWLFTIEDRDECLSNHFE